MSSNSLTGPHNLMLRPEDVPTERPTMRHTPMSRTSVAEDAPSMWTSEMADTANEALIGVTQSWEAPAEHKRMGIVDLALPRKPICQAPAEDKDIIDIALPPRKSLVEPVDDVPAVLPHEPAVEFVDDTLPSLPAEHKRKTTKGGRRRGDPAEEALGGRNRSREATGGRRTKSPMLRFFRPKSPYTPPDNPNTPTESRSDQGDTADDTENSDADKFRKPYCNLVLSPGAVSKSNDAFDSFEHESAVAFEFEGQANRSDIEPPSARLQGERGRKYFETERRSRAVSTSEEASSGLSEQEDNSAALASLQPDEIVTIAAL